MPGIQFFADLKKAGNLQQVDVTTAPVLSGDMPIALDWTYNFPGLQKQLADAGFTMQVDRAHRRRLRRLLRAGGRHAVQAPVRRAALARAPRRRRRCARLPRGRRDPGPVRRRCPTTGKITDDLKKNLPSPDVIAKVGVPDPGPDRRGEEGAGGQLGPDGGGTASHSMRTRALAGLPFLAFVGLFLLYPTAVVLWRSLTPGGSPGTASLRRAISDPYQASFINSINLSAASALIGAVVGLALALAIHDLERPRWLKPVFESWSAVASQLGGVPLAFAFVAAIGTQGILTKVVRESSGFNLIDHHLGPTGFWGLVTSTSTSRSHSCSS